MGLFQLFYIWLYIGFLLDLIMAIDIMPSKCGPENDLKQDGTKCARCRRNEYFCSLCYYKFIKVGPFLHCLGSCFHDQLLLYPNKTNVQECLPCSKACISGCNGPESIISDNGCTKCKYGIIENGKKKCLEAKSEYGSVCHDNGYTNFYLKPATEKDLEWAKHVCKEETNWITIFALVLFAIITIVAMISSIIYYWLKKKSKRHRYGYDRKRNKYPDLEKALIPDPESSDPDSRPRRSSNKHRSKDVETSENSVEIPWNKERIFISAKEVQVDKNNKLGSGAFGNVYKGRFQNKDVAVKEINSTDEIKKALSKEVRIMDRCEHENILSVIAVSLGEQFFIVTELQKSDLLTSLKSQTRVELNYLYLYCAQIASGMDYLVQKNILHSDLAARNILMKSDEHVLISDFGLFEAFEKDIAARNYENVPWRWWSVECLHGDMLTHENDVWSYGVTCWEIFNLCKEDPYKKLIQDNPIKLREYLKGGGRLERPEEYCKKITYWKIAECWAKEPNDRPKFKELYQFFNEIEQQFKKDGFYHAEIDDGDCYKGDVDDEFYAYSEDEEFDISFDFDIQSKSVSYTNETIGASTYATPNEINSFISSARPISISSDSAYGSVCMRNTNDESYKEKSKVKEQYTKVVDTYNQAPKIKIQILEEFKQVLINELQFSGESIKYEFDPNELIKLDLNVNELEFQNIIAEETFDNETEQQRTEVGRYRHGESGKLMAVKRINITKNLKQTILEYNVKNFLREIKRLQDLRDCENIVQFYGFCFDNNYAMICMELMDWSLNFIHKQYIEQNKTLPVKFISSINSSLLNALEQCYINKIIYGNVQTENVLISKDGMIKLADLRMSSKLQEYPEYPLTIAFHDIYYLGYLLFLLALGPNGGSDLYDSEEFDSVYDRNSLKSQEFLYGADYIKFVQACRHCKSYNELKKLEFYQAPSKETNQTIILTVCKELGI